MQTYSLEINAIQSVPKNCKKYQKKGYLKFLIKQDNVVMVLKIIIILFT